MTNDKKDEQIDILIENRSNKIEIPFITCHKFHKQASEEPQRSLWNL